MSVAHYLSILLSISTIIIDSSASKNVSFNGYSNTPIPTEPFDTFTDISADASLHPRSISLTTTPRNSTAPDEILIGEYKSNEDYLDCQAGKY